MAKKAHSKIAEDGSQLVAENRKARHQYEILETLECGLVLTGSEVKSLRNGKVSLEEAFGRVVEGEFWLLGCDIAEYPQATHWNHEPKRRRKLLVHGLQLRKFAQKAKEKGLTLVPLRIYFNARGVAKVQMALCKGRKLHDKRQVLKKAEGQRDLQRATRRRGR